MCIKNFVWGLIFEIVTAVMACQLSDIDGQKVIRRISNREDGGGLGLDRQVTQIWSVFLLF